MYYYFPEVIALIKAVVFDLDHTLFDRYETLRAVVPSFRQKFKINESITDEFFTEQLIWADKHYVHHGWEEIFAHLIKCNIFEEIPDYDEYVEYLLSCFKKVAVKFPFAIPVLQELKASGYKIGLITNGRPDVQEKKLALLELKPYFDEIIISGATPYRKPQSEIFKLMAQKLNIQTNEMVYVGDHPHFDVEGSRNAGCIPVWVKTTGTWIFPELEKPELQIETVEELPQILQKK